MTKEEVLTAVANHRNQVRECYLAVESVLQALISGWEPTGGEAGTIDDLKEMLSHSKDLSDEASDLLDSWPI